MLPRLPAVRMTVSPSKVSISPVLRWPPEVVTLFAWPLIAVQALPSVDHSTTALTADVPPVVCAIGRTPYRMGWWARGMALRFAPAGWWGGRNEQLRAIIADQVRFACDDRAAATG